MRNKTATLAILLAAVAVTSAPQVVPAATVDWSGATTGTASEWATSTNWTNNSGNPPTAGTIVRFNTLGASLSIPVAASSTPIAGGFNLLSNQNVTLTVPAGTTDVATVGVFTLDGGVDGNNDPVAAQITTAGVSTSGRGITFNTNVKLNTNVSANLQGVSTSAGVLRFAGTNPAVPTSFRPLLDGNGKTLSVSNGLLAFGGSGLVTDAKNLVVDAAGSATIGLSNHLDTVNSSSVRFDMQDGAKLTFVSVTYNGGIKLLGTGIVENSGGNRSLTLSGTVSEDASPRKLRINYATPSGSQKVTFSGAAANTYSGGTEFNVTGADPGSTPTAKEATLVLSKSSALGTGVLSFVGTSGRAQLTVDSGFGGLSSTGGVGLVIGDNATTTRTLTLTSPSAATNVTYSGTIGQGTFAVTGGNNLAVSKAGDGIQKLSGNNTYTGVTTVSAGTLLINGTHIGGAAYTISGGTLGGTGSTASSVGVANAGALSPGDGNAEDLALGALSLADLSTLAFNLDTPDVPGVLGAGGNDLIDVNGSLSLDGKLDITAGSNFGLGIYTLFTYDSLAADNGLDVRTAPGAFSYNITTTTLAGSGTPGSVLLTVVPEPAALSLCALGGLAMLRRRRA